MNAPMIILRIDIEGCTVEYTVSFLYFVPNRLDLPQSPDHLRDFLERLDRSLRS